MSSSVNVDVNVLATRHAVKGVDFLCTWADNSGAWQSGPITIPYGASRNRMKFRLDDRTGLGLEFLTGPDDACWFNEGQCPSGAQDNDLGQITDKAVHKDLLTRKRKKLTLTNLNTEECSLHYALRFTGRAASDTIQPPYVCDPEVRNGGGGQR